MSEIRTILVTGSRTWDDERRMKDAIRDAVFFLTELSHEVSDDEITFELVHGNAKGADKLSEKVCAELARDEGFPFKEPRRFPADWSRYGWRRAGDIRNKEMVLASSADIALAFICPCDKEKCRIIKEHPSHGTTNCVQEINRRRIKVIKYFDKFNTNPELDLATPPVI